MLFSERTISQVRDVHVLKQIFILSVKLLKTTTDVAVSKRSNKTHLNLDNCQLYRIFIDILGLLAT